MSSAASVSANTSLKIIGLDVDQTFSPTPEKKGILNHPLTFFHIELQDGTALKRDIEVMNFEPQGTFFDALSRQDDDEPLQPSEGKIAKQHEAAVPQARTIHVQLKETSQKVFDIWCKVFKGEKYQEEESIETLKSLFLTSCRFLTPEIAKLAFRSYARHPDLKKEDMRVIFSHCKNYYKDMEELSNDLNLNQSTLPNWTELALESKNIEFQSELARRCNPRSEEYSSLLILARNGNDAAVTILIDFHDFKADDNLLTPFPDWLKEAANLDSVAALIYIAERCSNSAEFQANFSEQAIPYLEKIVKNETALKKFMILDLDIESRLLEFMENASFELTLQFCDAFFNLTHDPQFYVTKFSVLHQSGKTEEAREILKQILKLDPKIYIVEEMLSYPEIIFPLAKRTLTQNPRLFLESMFIPFTNYKNRSDKKIEIETQIDEILQTAKTVSRNHYETSTLFDDRCKLAQVAIQLGAPLPMDNTLHFFYSDTLSPFLSNQINLWNACAEIQTWFKNSETPLETKSQIQKMVQEIFLKWTEQPEASPAVKHLVALVCPEAI